MTQPLAAIVLTRGRFGTDAAVIARKVGERFEFLDVSAEIRIDSGPNGARYVLDLDGVEIMVIYAGRPIAQDIMAGLARNIFDEDDPSTAHRDQVIITAFGEVEGHEATLQTALAILRIAVVLAEDGDATAVYWSPTEMLTSAPLFLRMMRADDAPDEIPTTFLSRFIPYTEGGTSDARRGLAVLGLHRFIGRDIEFTPTALPVAVIMGCSIDASGWLLQKGLVFADGDTCGGSADEIIRVRYADRGRISPHPVLELTIEKLDRPETAYPATLIN